MKQAFRLLMVTLGLTAISSAGVTVSSPTNGSTVGSPVHVVASASSTHPITAMRIYVDNVSVFVTSSGNIDTSVAMSAAKHNVVVQAWDSSGAVFKTAVSITVSGSTPVSGLPAPPFHRRDQVQYRPDDWVEELHSLCRSRRQRSNFDDFDGREHPFAITGRKIRQVQHQRHDSIFGCPVVEAAGSCQHGHESQV